MHESEEKRLQNSSRKKLKGSDHLEDIVADGRTLKWRLKKHTMRVLNWIHLAHDKSQRQAVPFTQPAGKREFGGPKRTGEDNIKMNMKDTGCEGVGWIQLALFRKQWRALLSMAMNLGGIS
jgi:hypothetical protein